MIDPADGSVLTDVADASIADAVEALDAAVEAQADWAATPPRKRGEILRTAFGLITDRADQFAHLMSLEMGKTARRGARRGGLRRRVLPLVRRGGGARRRPLQQAPAGGSRILTVQKPVGPCVFITPWNFPLAMGARKIAPALAAGCTTITKPAGQTPLTMLVLARSWTRRASRASSTWSPPAVPASSASPAGRPPAPQALVHRVDRGRAACCSAQAADKLRGCMELGGNAALIVCADADLDVAVDGAMVAKMRNIGESCIAANRIFEQPVREEFTARFAERMGGLSMGHGLDDGVDVGALIDEASVEIDQLVTDAVDEAPPWSGAASVRTGPGHFYPPTVLVDVPDDAGCGRRSSARSPRSSRSRPTTR